MPLRSCGKYIYEAKREMCLGLPLGFPGVSSMWLKVCNYDSTGLYTYVYRRENRNIPAARVVQI